MKKQWKTYRKRIFAAVLCLSMLCSMAACGGADTGKKSLENGTETSASDEAEAFSSEDAEAEQEAFEQYLDDYFAYSVTADTMTYNYSVKNGETYGLTEPEVTLGDPGMTEDEIAEDEAEFNEWALELAKINRSLLTSDEQLTYDVLNEYFEVQACAYDNVYLYEPFSPMRGLQANIATMFTDYRFDDKGDVERYIALMNQIPEYFQEYLDFERVKSEKGYFMSDAVCEKVIAQCEEFAADKDNHFMITVFNENIAELDFLTDEEKTAYQEQNKEAVQNSLIPAFENVISVFTELKGTGTNDGGVCNYDGGKEYYEYLLKSFAGTSKSADEVIEMLDTELQSLMTEMYLLYMTNADAYEYFVENYDTIFAATDDMTATEMIDKMMQDVSEHYPDCGTISYQAKDLDESLETIMSDILAYYMSPAIDDQENNLIRVNGLHTDGLWTTHILRCKPLLHKPSARSASVFLSLSYSASSPCMITYRPIMIYRIILFAIL